MSPSADFDHLVVAVPNLADSVEQCHNALGARPIPGGAHPRLGTANALLGLRVSELGRDALTYLEILGPDPDQDPALAAARLSGTTTPTVQRWAIRPRDFDGLVAHAARTLGPECAGGPEGDTRGERDGGSETPEVDRTRSVLRFLDATLEVEAGATDSLHAILKGPGGSWTL
ncbi:VOC family protein [Brevibacterium oceani]|uniref:VOC family protein n=1 Tax=Brevibacterium oceani TaxID=358099 RepID=UPI001B3380B5|nr:VOC family protein [Brevibacterium oceani]